MPDTTPAQAPTPAKSSRRGDMDLLRAIACCVIVPAHAFPPYMADFPYHVKDPDRLGAFSVNIEMLPTFCLITFFFLAGWAAVAMLKSRSPWQFIRDRWWRLGVPLFAWMFLVGPVVKYFERMNGQEMKLARYIQSPPAETDFLRFLLRYYTRFDHFGWSHLWFLAYLLLVSVLVVPLASWMARRATRDDGRVAPWHWAYAPILVFLAIELLWRSYWPYYPNLIADWARVAFFGMFFVFGAAALWRPAFEARIKAEAWRLLPIGVACWIYFVFARDSTVNVFGGGHFSTLPDTLPVRVAFAAGAWCITMGAYGALARRRIVPGPVVRYLSEASMPVYILHHAISIVIAYHVAQTAWPIWAKIPLIAASTMIATFLLYHFAVRRIGLLRLLHGMPPERRKAAALLPA